MNDQLRILADRMDELDDELYAAERAGNVSAQIAALRERARCWREWGEHLKANGRDHSGSELAAMRDESTADRLAGGAL
jgi:hypothetical protein